MHAESATLPRRQTAGLPLIDADAADITVPVADPKAGPTSAVLTTTNTMATSMMIRHRLFLLITVNIA
jgi:hypothetical protein